MGRTEQDGSFMKYLDFMGFHVILVCYVHCASEPETPRCLHPQALPGSRPTTSPRDLHRDRRELRLEHRTLIQVVDLQTGNTPDVPADLVLFDTFAAYRRSLDRIDEMADRPHLGKTVLYTWDLPPAFADELGDRDVDAIILKSMTGERLVEALEQTAAGNPPSLDDQSITSSSITLTDRELEVFALVAVGSSNAEIAQQLYLSIDTVKTHLRKLYGKLGVRNRTEAALRAPEFGLRRRTESPLVDA